jgi:hypothetical protein
MISKLKLFQSRRGNKSKYGRIIDASGRKVEM